MCVCEISPNAPSVSCIAGIDPNDQAKTMAACTFFTSVCRWLPLTGKIDRFSTSTPPPPSNWVDETSFAEKEEFEVNSMSRAMERLPEVLPTWGLSLLERLITLVEQSGEPSKKYKTPIDYLNTVSAMGSSSEGRLEVDLTRSHATLMNINAANDLYQSWSIFNLSISLFSQMDEQTLQCATRTLLVFCLENSCCGSVKDAANLIRSLVAASPEKGLRNCLPALAEGFETRKKQQCRLDVHCCVGFLPLISSFMPPCEVSVQTKAWRLRLMSGAVRNAGASTLQHIPLLQQCLDIGLQSPASSDKGVLKSACKLFRRLLSTLLSRYCMNRFSHNSGKLGDKCPWQLCAPVACDSEALDIQWHEPSEEERFMASELINVYVKQPLNSYSDSTPTEEWRRGLKVATYALVGAVCASVEDAENGDDEKFIAVGAVGDWGKGAEHTTSLRHWTLAFVHSAFNNILLSENGKTKTPDPKVLKLLMEMGQLAVTRRSFNTPSKVRSMRLVVVFIAFAPHSCKYITLLSKIRPKKAYITSHSLIFGLLMNRFLI